VIGAVADVVICKNCFEGFFFLFGFNFVVLFFLRQVFLNLLYIGIALGGRRENTGDVQWLNIGIGGLFFLPDSF